MRVAAMLVFVVAGLEAQQERVFEAAASVPVRAALTEAVANVRVSTAAGLEQVLRTLEPAGVTRTHLIGSTSRVSLGNFTIRLPSSRSHSHRFRVPAAAGEMETLEQALIKLEQSIPPVFVGSTDEPLSYSIDYTANRADLSRSRKAVIAPLFDEARRQIDGAVAAASLDAGLTITLAELMPGPGEMTIRLIGERAGPFARRLVRVAVGSAALVSLDEARIGVEVVTDRSAARTAVLDKMAQAGFGERDLTAVSSRGPSGEAVRSYRFEIIRPALQADSVVDSLARQLALAPPFREIRIDVQLYASEGASAQAREAAMPDLIAEARGQAEIAARLMNGRLGALRGVYRRVTPAANTVSLGIVVPAARITPVASFLGFSQVAPAPNNAPDSGGAVVEFFVE